MQFSQQLLSIDEDSSPSTSAVSSPYVPVFALDAQYLALYFTKSFLEFYFVYEILVESCKSFGAGRRGKFSPPHCRP